MVPLTTKTFILDFGFGPTGFADTASTQLLTKQKGRVPLFACSLVVAPWKSFPAPRPNVVSEPSAAVQFLPEIGGKEKIIAYAVVANLFSSWINPTIGSPRCHPHWRTREK